MWDVSSWYQPQHIDQLYCQKFFEFLTFFKNPSLSEGILLSFVNFKELDTSVQHKKRFVLYLVRQNEINDNNLLYQIVQIQTKQIKVAMWADVVVVQERAVVDHFDN